MRIAIYHGTLPQLGQKPGGVDVFVHRLAHALAKRKHDVEVLTYSAPPADAGYVVRRMRPHITTSSRILRQYVAPWFFNLRSLHSYDVLHLHGDDWFFLRRPLPTVRTFHGSALLEARHATSWKRRIDKNIVFWLELLGAKLATSSYGVGPDSDIIYATRGTLPPGIEIPSNDDRVPAPHPTITFIGTWHGRKRGAFLHKIFLDYVKRAVPDAELWMVSDACEAGPGVRWLRAPSDTELIDLLKRSWIFCLPSVYEGFGIPYLEAMAHGVPVVATPNVGAQKLLDDGKYGVLVDDEQLANRLVRLLTDKGQRESLARAGRSRAQDYTWNRIAERHESAYAEAIDRWTANRAR